MPARPSPAEHPVDDVPLFTRTARPAGESPGPATLPDDARRAARIGARVGIAAGVAWLALGLESTIRGGEMHYRDPLWMVPWVLTMATLAALYRAQRHALPPRGRVAARLLGGTMVLVLAGNVGLSLGLDGLAVLGFPIGATLWLAAMIPFGVATVRAGVVPRRVGIALALLEPGSILCGILLSPIAGLHDRGSYSGGIEKGAVLLLVALALAALEHRRNR